MTIDMKDLARLGATTRLNELQQEIAEIHRAFPDLGGRKRGRRVKEGSAASLPSPPTDRATKGRTRKPMTAAQKKAVSERMRKYWAARKKAEKK